MSELNKPLSVKLIKVIFITKIVLITFIICTCLIFISIPSGNEGIFYNLKQGFFNAYGTNANESSFNTFWLFCGVLSLPITTCFVNIHAINKKKKKLLLVFVVLNIILSMRTWVDFIISIMVCLVVIINRKFNSYMESRIND